LSKTIFILFLFIWAMNVVLLCLGIETESRWAEGLLIIWSAIANIAILGRRLPLQNIVTCSVIIALTASILAITTVITGIPFGPVNYSEVFGEKFFSVLPWTVPFIWIMVVINGRGVARLIMRPWRKTNYYGFWVIGLTCLLAVLLDLSLEPFAVASQYWFWQVPDGVWTWYSAPWSNFLGWFITALAALVFAMPWLINKQPIKQPMDYQPLILWLLMNAWLITGNARHQLWFAVTIGILGNLIATVFTVRGARWVSREA
jgi:uncharacterized membrane protein